MAAWVGPAIVAAVIATLVSVVGWFVTAYQTIRLEQRRRDEKARDFQIALRAEVRGELAWLDRFEPATVLEQLRARYRDEPDFVALVGELPQAVVFDAIVGEIYVLPEEVIDPIVLFMRQRQIVAGITKDIRNGMFRELPQERQLEIFQDYVGLMSELKATAAYAQAALNKPVP